MNSYELKPSVDASQEFIEIATDFSNPLDAIREAISNSFDAHAKILGIRFFSEKQYGERVLVVEFEDDGEGMDRGGLQAFFDLGNSLRRTDPEAIGEKGHGTKVFFNSSEVFVKTVRNGTKLEAVMLEPFKRLHDRELPKVSVVSAPTDEPNGTLIRIKGYNANRSDRFTHALIKDYIMWFSKFGSF